MRVYFLSEKPCALVVDGAYFGAVDTFERSAQLHLEDGLFLQFLPTEPYAPISFYLNEQTVYAPPQGLCVYHVRDGIALYATAFLPLDQRLKVLWQQTVDGNQLTLCRQGTLQLNIQNEKGFFLVDLPERLYPCTVKSALGGILLESQTAFALITDEGGVSVSSEGKVLSTEGTLTAEVPLFDSAQHCAVVTWQEGKITNYSIQTSAPQDASLCALALFESVLIGADCTPFLHENLLPKASSLKQFLGEFTSVLLTQSPTVVGLVYPVRERVFEVRYYQITLLDDKISNISPME